MSRAAALLLLAAALLAACSSRAIVARPPIPVPAGLAPAQVETAIRDALLGTRAGRYGLGRWVVERSVPGDITAGLRYRHHYLQLGIRYDEKEVATRILGSENLAEEDGTIKRHALNWQAQIEERIAAQLAAAR